MKFKEKILSKKNQLLLLAERKGYKVLLDGNIIGIKGDILNGRINTRGYKEFSIRDEVNGRHKIDYHRYIAYKKFGNKLFEEGIEVRHLDSNQSNNSWDNIAIGTHSENMFDKPKKVRLKQAIGASNKIRKFTDEVMKQIKVDREKGMTYKELMEKYSISSSGTLSYMLNNVYVTSK